MDEIKTFVVFLELYIVIYQTVLVAVSVQSTSRQDDQSISQSVSQSIVFRPVFLPQYECFVFFELLPERSCMKSSVLSGNNIHHEA